MHFYNTVLTDPSGKNKSIGVIKVKQRLLTKLDIQKLKVYNHKEDWFLKTATYLGEGSDKDYDPCHGMPAHQKHNWYAMNSRKLPRIN